MQLDSKGPFGHFNTRLMEFSRIGMVSSKEMKIAREHKVAAVSLSGLNCFNCVSLTDSMFYLHGPKTQNKTKQKNLMSVKVAGPI